MLRILAALAGLVLMGYIVWASMQVSMWVNGPKVLAEPWGMVTLVDLYAGVVLIAILMFLIERSALQRLLWIVPLFFLGNIWSALWLVVRFNHVRTRLGLG